jgi:hypothetical protein
MPRGDILMTILADVATAVWLLGLLALLVYRK